MEFSTFALYVIIAEVKVGLKTPELSIISLKLALVDAGRISVVE